MPAQQAEAKLPVGGTPQQPFGKGHTPARFRPWSAKPTPAVQARATGLKKPALQALLSLTNKQLIKYPKAGVAQYHSAVNACKAGGSKASCGRNPSTALSKGPYPQI